MAVYQDRRGGDIMSFEEIYREKAEIDAMIAKTNRDIAFTKAFTISFLVSFIVSTGIAIAKLCKQKKA